MKKKQLKRKRLFCPWCGRTDCLTYDDFVVVSAQEGYFPFKCDDCGGEGREIHKTIYSSTVRSDEYEY